MAHITIRLLGPFRVAVDQQPVTEFYSDKTRALLAYLAAEHGRPHRREALAGLLWPDFPETRARANLSQTLFALRKALAPSGSSAGVQDASPWLVVTREAMELRPGEDC